MREFRRLDFCSPAPPSQSFWPHAACRPMRQTRTTGPSRSWFRCPIRPCCPPPTARDVTTPATAAAAACCARSRSCRDRGGARNFLRRPRSSQTAACPALGALDQQVADKLREYLTGKADRIIERKSKQGRACYAARSAAAGKPTAAIPGERAKAVAKFLRRRRQWTASTRPIPPCPRSMRAPTPTRWPMPSLKPPETVLTYARRADRPRPLLQHQPRHLLQS